MSDQPLSADNPYASPAEASPVAVPSVGMPGSVRLSRACFCLVGLYFGLNLLGCLFSGSGAEELLLSAIIPLMAVAIMLMCLHIHTPIARRSCRLLATVSAVMMTLVLIAVTEMMFKHPPSNVVGSTTSYYGIPVSERLRPVFELFMITSIGFVAAGLWIPVVALGRGAARIYFSGASRSTADDA